jgi:hypothetical protein
LVLSPQQQKGGETENVVWTFLYWPIVW